jgi:hypothetical protein
MDECPKPKRHKKTGPTHGKVAALARHRPGSEEHAEAKREHKYRLAAETIENIKKMVAEWPASRSSLMEAKAHDLQGKWRQAR